MNQDKEALPPSPQPASAERPSREELLDLADELHSQALGGRAKAVAMLRRLAALALEQGCGDPDCRDPNCSYGQEPAQPPAAEQAVKALEPFASAADGLIDSLPDSYCIVLKMDAATPFAMVKVGELRAARTALSNIRGGKHE